MTANKVKLSIRSLCIWVVMAIAATTLVITSGLSVFTQIQSYQDELKGDAVMLATLLSARIREPLIAPEGRESRLTIEEQLSTLSPVDEILNVRVYKRLANRELKEYGSYVKNGEPASVTPASMLPRYVEPVITNDTIEITMPVEDIDLTNAGYVYVQMSADDYDSLAGRSILVNLFILVVMLCVSFLLALRFQQVITQPIEQLSEFLRLTSRQRDYTARAKSPKIRELSVLAEAINVMLNRIQEYTQRQQAAEDQHRKLNASLEDMVQQRTVALKEANQELIQTLEKLHQFQRQIVQNEKMASLGDMVAGVAHEVNTPIGLGVTASTMMLDRLAVIQQNFDNKTLKASAMSRFLSESQENLNIIYRNLNRAAELISSFKQVAVDQSNENYRTFCFAQLVNEILLSLRPRLKKFHHHVHIDCDPTLVIESKAGPVNQVLINLIMNSVIHGFEDMDSGRIDIIAEMVSPKKMKLIYKDDGKGIPEHIRKRIFDPFVTTKRGQGGSGLGMHLVYNLVTQALNGSIALSSDEGKGVEFIIIFPVISSESGELPAIEQ